MFRTVFDGQSNVMLLWKQCNRSEEVLAQGSEDMTTLYGNPSNRVEVVVVFLALEYPTLELSGVRIRDEF